MASKIPTTVGELIDQLAACNRDDVLDFSPYAIKSITGHDGSVEFDMVEDHSDPFDTIDISEAG